MKVFTAEFFANHGRRGGSTRSKKKSAASRRNLELARKKRWNRSAETGDNSGPK